MWQERIQLREQCPERGKKREGHLLIASTYSVRWEVRSSGENDVEQEAYKGKGEGVPSHCKNGVMNELGECTT